MKRKIIEIDEAKCDGCGQCVDACHEGALALVDGKARLVTDVYCDGLGACIGECPTGALRIVEREAPAFDAAAVASQQQAAVAGAVQGGHHHAGHGHHGQGGCPGAAMRSLAPGPGSGIAAGGAGSAHPAEQPSPSALGHWPVQLMLVPPHAPFLKGADLVVCADCVPFAVPDFHARYLQGRAVVVGCPKLDDLGHYVDKLKAMVREAGPRRLTVLRMEVPCCRGLSQAAIQAAGESGSDFPVEEHVIGIGGEIERHVVGAQTPP